MTLVTFRLATLIVAVALGACTGTPQRRAQPESAPPPTGNADALLANAIQTYAASRDPAQALAFARAAAEKAPKRPELVLLYAHFCGQVAGCDAAAAETQLRKLDPANGIAWMGALSRAQRQRDASAQEQIVEALSGSERIDVYWNRLLAHATVALHGANPTQTKGIDDPLTSSMNTAVDQLSLIAATALRPIAAACSKERVQRTATANRCARIARILRNSDTYIAAGIGLGIEERMATPGTPTAQAVDDAIRVARYQQETAGRILESQVDRAALSRELIKLMQSLRSEQEVFGAVLRWAGQPLRPD